MQTNQKARMKRKEILLLEGDYTQCLPTAKSLHKHGYVIDGVFSDKWSYGYGSRYIRNKYIFKDTGDTKAYYEYIVDLLQTHHYDAIIPLNDESATLLAYYKEELLKYALGISHQLDAKYGKRTISAKATDVPGMTKAMIAPLVHAGILRKTAQLTCFSLTGYSGGGGAQGSSSPRRSAVK